MLGSIGRCPRCGGHRLARPSPPGILLICAGCGLRTTEPELPPPPGVIKVGTDLESRGRRETCRQALPASGLLLTPRNYP
jgi:hypothetical protein